MSYLHLLMETIIIDTNKDYLLQVKAVHGFVAEKVITITQNVFEYHSVGGYYELKDIVIHQIDPKAYQRITKSLEDNLKTWTDKGENN